MKLNRTFIIPKNSVAAGNVDINKIIKSDASEYGTNKKTDAKFFIGQKIEKKIRPLCIKFPKNEKVYQYFQTKQTHVFPDQKNELLEKHNKIWYKFLKKNICILK